MANAADREAFYIKLKGQLEETTSFPSNYLYKFIVPSNGSQSEEVKNIFNKGAVITTKKSRTGKYISVSINLKVKNADEVIAYYKQADKIEGIISL